MPESRRVTFEKLIKLVKPKLNIINLLAALIFLVIVVSGACFFMVLVQWIKPSGIWPDTVDNWYEVNSQILNACFTILALITHPYRIALAYWTLKWKKAEGRDEKEIWAAKIKLSMPEIILFPCNVNSTNPISDTCQSTKQEPCQTADLEVIIVEDSQPSSSISRPSVKKSPIDYSTPTKTWYAILLLLNLNCIFQYPITIAMWYYIGQASVRPPLIIGIFLPLSFLCGFASGIWPMMLQRDRKRKETRPGSVDTAVCR